MKIVCIKSGKCIVEGSGFIEVQEGDKGSIIEKIKRSDVLVFINGTRVVVPFDHLSGEADPKSFLACFKIIDSNISESKKINTLINLLEKYSGKKVILK